MFPKPLFLGFYFLDLMDVSGVAPASSQKTCHGSLWSLEVPDVSPVTFSDPRHFLP